MFRHNMTTKLFLSTILFSASIAVASPVSAEEDQDVHEQNEETRGDEDSNGTSSEASSMETRIGKYTPIHRNIALGAYLGFVLSDLSGIAAAVLLHMDKNDSTGYDALRYTHSGLGFLSILAFFPQAVFAWRIGQMKEKLGWPADRKHRIAGILTSVGVVLEIAGIATLAVLGARDSSHLETMATVHCATSTFMVVLPFTFSLFTGR